MSVWSELVRWGVIDAARRRQRRHRAAIGVVVLAIGLAAVIVVLNWLAGAHPSGPQPQPSSSMTWLTGPRLGPANLQLVVSENGGPVSIVDVDSRRVTPLRQLDVPSNGGLWRPMVTLSSWRGKALAVVTRQPCANCAITEDDYSITNGAAVRHLATRHFAAFKGTIERAQVPGSLTEWVLRRPKHGRCTLQLVPSARPAMSVPCGDLGAVHRNAIVLLTHQDQHSIVIDANTGAVRRRLDTTRILKSIGHGFAIEGPNQGVGDLRLVNLATGARRKLGWPSRLGFDFQVFPDPAAALVAVEFADPAYPDYSSPRPSNTLGQAADLWLLNLRTGKFTHLPGFPIYEALKASDVAWTADGRLIIAADGGSFSQPAKRVAVGVWRPGQSTVRVGALPPAGGYSQFVPLSR
jgi:hypothetical protein